MPKVWVYSSRRRMKPGVPDRITVVRHGDRARGNELADLGHLLSLEPARRRPHRVDPGAPSTLAGGPHEADGRRIVDRRIRVRHRPDGGKPAGGGGSRAALDRLLVLVAGLAEVHVEVDKARSHDETIHVHDLGIIGTGDARTAGLDAAVPDQELARPVQLP